MTEQFDYPVWFNGKDIVEASFCDEFMDGHQLTYDSSAFFTPEGRMTDERLLKQEIYHCSERKIEPVVVTDNLNSFLFRKALSCNSVIDEF